MRCERRHPFLRGKTDTSGTDMYSKCSQTNINPECSGTDTRCERANPAIALAMTYLARIVGLEAGDSLRYHFIRLIITLSLARQRMHCGLVPGLLVL